jgi:hypothetical protein
VAAQPSSVAPSWLSTGAPRNPAVRSVSPRVSRSPPDTAAVTEANALGSASATSRAYQDGTA